MPIRFPTLGAQITQQNPDLQIHAHINPLLHRYLTLRISAAILGGDGGDGGPGEDEIANLPDGSWPAYMHSMNDTHDPNSTAVRSHLRGGGRCVSSAGPEQCPYLDDGVCPLSQICK